MVKICQKCNKEFVKPYICSRTEWGSRKYCSHSCANSVNLNGKLFKNGQPSVNKGRKLPERSGENHPRWNSVAKTCDNCDRGFVVRDYLKHKVRFCSPVCRRLWFQDNSTSSIRDRIESMQEYKDWRQAVFERDEYTCQECGQRGGKLHAHHILRFSEYPELRFDVSNGRTLCVACHLLTETFGNRKTTDMVAINEEA